MQYLVFTEEFCKPQNLHPFTLTKQIQDLRIGILTIREKWEQLMDMPSVNRWENNFKDNSLSIRVDKDLDKGPHYLIHGNILPDKGIVSAVKKLKNGELLSTKSGEGIAMKFSSKEISGAHKIRVSKMIAYKKEVKAIHQLWDLFELNDWAIRADFALITGKRKSATLPKNVIKTGVHPVFIEKGATIYPCFINTENGPVYIGKNTTIMEGVAIRGPFTLGESAVVKMGAIIYGATSVGPHSVVGGEIKNCNIMAFSNKAHDGYLGDSVIGEWCNLGAGTSNSNLKNNASLVGIWNQKEKEIIAGLKCGIFMGDHSKSAIHTCFNTGTVIGVCANVIGQGLTPKYIPHFSWGSEGIKRYKLEKAIKDINSWMAFKGKSLSLDEVKMLKHIFAKY